jgi:hypothetical protein
MRKLEMLLLSCLLINVTTACFAAAPMVLRIVNNTGVDVQAQVVDAKHIDGEDIRTLEAHTIYAGKTVEYTIDRTDAPAEFGVHFRAALEEGEVSGYSVGRWEYVESTPRFPIDTGLNQYTYLVDSCHNYAAETPYVLSCVGNDNFTAPSVTLTIDNQFS